jgi:LysR family glycine cleavage system transcriptional activator
MAKLPHYPLTALRAFEVTARRLSFRLAADELGITQSAISHQIAALETQLNVRLFDRRTRRVELSQEGTLLYPYVKSGFDQFAHGLSVVSQAERADELTLQVYVTVAMRWLMPRLGSYRQSNPKMAVRLLTSHLDWEFDPQLADFGLIWTKNPHRANFAYTRLFEAQLVCVASPKLLGQKTSLDLADISQLRLLQVYTARDDWQLWLAALGLDLNRVRAQTSYDSYLLAIEAAIDGQGVAVVPEFLVADDLASGRLVLPFAHKVAQPGAWYLVCRQERSLDPRIRRFSEWLVGEIEKSR